MVVAKVFLSNRTHKKLSISPQATVAECLVLVPFLNLLPLFCFLVERTVDFFFFFFPFLFDFFLFRWQSK